MKHKKLLNDYDCTSCRGEKHKCLNVNRELILQAPEIQEKTFKINVGNWQQLLDAWHKNLPSDLKSDAEILQCFNLCPIPLFLPFSSAVIRLHSGLGGFGSMDYQAFLNAPNIFIETIELINSEQSRMDNRLMGQNG